MVMLVTQFLQLLVVKEPVSSYIIFISLTFLILILVNIVNVCHSLIIIVAVTKIVFKRYGIISSLQPPLRLC
jgi:hypothetical protein